MIFRRLILASLVVGLLAGLALTAVQMLTVNPIIFAAEAFEVPDNHDHGSHDHGEEAWAPADGAERNSYTALSNVLAGIGFSAMMLALMSQLQGMGLTALNVPKGLAWGLAGFAACFLAPAIGLPPEIPGIEAAPVEHRQSWWLLAVALVAIGLFVLALAPLKWKGLSLVLIAIPYLVGAPHPAGPAFSHPDPAAVAQLEALHQQFILASGGANLLFWMVLGLVSAWMLNAWVLKRSQQGALGEQA